MTYFTVDRIEGEVAVLEDENGDTAPVPCAALPAVAAGDVLAYADGRYTVDREETAKRRDAAFALEQKLRNR